MNVLFLTMAKTDVSQSGIYNDLMRKFRDEDHSVYIVMPTERREGKQTSVSDANDVHTLSVRTLNLQKTNVIEKGLGQLSLEWLYFKAINKYFGNIQFDLILYSTPPITFTKVIKQMKKKIPKALCYLMLKDIFPQNAVDLGMLKKNGLKGILYRTFRKKEKELYKISDFIGCMSPANVKYVIEHNPDIDSSKVEICPNSYDIPAQSIETNKKQWIREKYKLPLDKPIFIYGGNMGQPQGIPFLIDCMKAVRDRRDCHFVIVGDGTNYHKIESWINVSQPKSVSLFKSFPKVDYDALANACDIGLIFLDYRFTIPNYPSRLLPYLMTKKPIIAVTDKNCDTGTIAMENGYGFYCPSNSVERFIECVDKILYSNIQEMGNKGYQFFINNYTTEHTYYAIMKHL